MTSRSVGELFDGGAREAVLDAVMKVSRERLSQRFFARNAGYGYAGIASPIVVDGALDAIVVLLHPAPEGSQRILNIQREIDDPLHEIRKALDIVLEQTGGRRASRYRYVVEGARHAAARALEWSTQLRRMLTRDELPGAESSGAFDPAAVLRTVAQAAFEDAARQGVLLDLQSKNSLPPVRGDRIQLETMLIRLVRERLGEGQPLASVALSARSVGGKGTRHVVMAMTEQPKPGADLDAPATPQLLSDLVQAIGGSLQNISNPSLGRSLVFRFPQAG
ncbi:MAG: hypothetical protein HKP27_00985 [Myxococcales bacterium]|nr:hypothetical protein [Myxococcales bacterium]